MDKYRRDTWAVRELIGKTAFRLFVMVVVVVMVFMITRPAL